MVLGTKQHLAVLFADICDSMGLFRRHGDRAAHHLVTDSLHWMEEQINRADGKLLRTVGDSVLAVFPSAENACQAAISMHEVHRNSPLALRIGFHYGLCILDKGDVYGSTVNIAARIAGLAASNEIITTSETFRLLSEQQRIHAVQLDEITVKGLEHPIQLCRLQWRREDVTNQTAVFSALPHSLSDKQCITLVLVYRGRRILINEEHNSFEIGRSDACDLQLHEIEASRKHARIEYRQGKYLLTDHSSNGTYVQKQNEEVLLLRRETTFLSGRGVIGAGILPETDSESTITFEFSETM